MAGTLPDNDSEPAILYRDNGYRRYVNDSGDDNDLLDIEAARAESAVAVRTWAEAQAVKQSELRAAMTTASPLPLHAFHSSSATADATHAQSAVPPVRSPSPALSAVSVDIVYDSDAETYLEPRLDSPSNVLAVGHWY